MQFYTLDSFIKNIEIVKNEDLFIVDDLHSKDDDEFIKNFIKLNRKNFDFILYYGKDLLVEFYYLFLDSKFDYIEDSDKLEEFFFKGKKILLIVTDKNSKDLFNDIEFMTDVMQIRESKRNNISMMYYGQENEIIENLIPTKINLIKKQNLKGLLPNSEYEKAPNNFIKLEKTRLV